MAITNSMPGADGTNGERICGSERKRESNIIGMASFASCVHNFFETENVFFFRRVLRIDE